jgi:prophage regulatory protein
MAEPFPRGTRLQTQTSGVPYSDMHIWRLEKSGRFPKRIRLGPNRVGWSAREVAAWIEARKAERKTSC